MRLLDTVCALDDAEVVKDEPVAITRLAVIGTWIEREGCNRQARRRKHHCEVLHLLIQ